MMTPNKNVSEEKKDTIMKKFAISLIALAAVSTASFASSNRSNDLRDSDTYYGKYSAQSNVGAAGVNAIAVVQDANALTNFERLNKVAQENSEGGH